MDKKVDDVIEWVPVERNTLPEEMDNDQLCVLLKLLIARVKDDHATRAYEKDVSDYIGEIINIYNLVKQNGYKGKITKENSNEINDDDNKNNDNNNDGIDYSKIMDA